MRPYPAWSLAPPRSIRRLPGGYTADVWTVTTPHARFIAKYAYDSQAAFERGLRAAELLEEHGIPSGGPLRTRDGGLSLPVIGPHGRAEPLAVLQFVDGQPLDWQTPHAPMLIGRHLARTHTVLDESLLATDHQHEDVLGYLREHTSEVAVQPGLQSLIDHTILQVERFEAQVRVTYGGVYGDGMEFLYNPHAQHLALIDWGAFRWGPLLIDLALATTGFRTVTPHWQEQLQQFYHAYVPGAPIGAAEVAGVSLYAAMMAAERAKYFAWRVAHDVTLGDPDPEGNQRSLVHARRELETWLATLAE